MRRRDFFRSIAGSAALAAAVPAAPLLARLIRRLRRSSEPMGESPIPDLDEKTVAFNARMRAIYSQTTDAYPDATAIEKQAAYQARRATEALARKIAQQWDGVSI